MSAFVCSNTHISALAHYAAQSDVSYYFNKRWHQIRRGTDGEKAARILMQENIRSVNARYGDQETLESVGFRYIEPAKEYPAVQIIKACHCLNYQSCETKDWTRTQAHALLRAIENAAMRGLAGYEDADWEINAPLAPVGTRSIVQTPLLRK